MTKAFVLAAGQGKRFLPFSKKTPKPLFKIGEVSLIENNLKNLKQSGVDEVVINIFHLGEKIIDAITIINVVVVIVIATIICILYCHTIQ